MRSKIRRLRGAPDPDRSWRTFVLLVRAWTVALGGELLLLGVSHLLPAGLATGLVIGMGVVVGLLLLAAAVTGVALTRRAVPGDEAWLAAYAADGIADLEAMLARQVSEES